MAEEIPPRARPLPTRDELSPWMTRYVLDRDHADEIRVRDESAWEFRVLGGVLERVRRAARAYLVLDRRGFAAEGRFIVRSAIEHAVTAQWAYLTPDGIDRLHVKMVQARLDYAEQNRDSADPQWAGIIANIKAQFPRTRHGARKPGAPKFSGKEGILAMMDTTGYLQRAYAVLSRVGHVSDQAVSDYFVTEPDGTIAVTGAPSEDFDLEVFHTIATCSALAAWVRARLEGDEQGIELASSQRLLYRLDTHLDSALRRFPEEEN
ncbi:DUF5677 domain-containing protein [Curtobacterium poinsettiae]|uniref:DUF5677 domain-containing protein n=1 Tax=Curtobacterium poinsettiae TaxID=159612 RepID=UPI0021C6913D|nr:DUF5677 domain-containing protein [Curtobacterium flaccumfaciens]MCU0151352.1 hypothetical protein [Curtobacterium flaccumfaciens pv. poinsettiae]UXN16628.1 hypothetical protein N8D76_08070 [Curtobacterium flaccumfaciens pv. poinsettiae]